MNFIDELENLPEDEFEVAVNRILKRAGKEDDLEYRIKISALLINIIENMKSDPENEIDVEID
jgi:hypothetical protein